MIRHSQQAFRHGTSSSHNTQQTPLRIVPTSLIKGEVMIEEFRPTLDRVPHQRLTVSVGELYTERETGVRLIKHQTAGNKENVQGGRNKVIEYFMG